MSVCCPGRANWSISLPRRLTRISVAFGAPLFPDECADEPDRDRRIERLISLLRERVEKLRESLAS